jgi:predicted RNA-binding Zn ribbon-like protein
MEPVALDPGDYDGTYKLIGGEISLDFLNTVSWPGTAREHDWLDRYENVTAWAVAAGAIGEHTQRVLDARPRGQARKELRQLHRTREDLRGVIGPLAHGERPAPQAVETLNELVRKTCRYRRIDPARQQWTWVEPRSLTEILAPVIWNAAYVLTSVDHTRLSHCPSCDWIFYDITRNRSRKWCDMVDCGSRDKALRYYHRTKSAGNS